jgi:hypothetical protein
MEPPAPPVEVLPPLPPANPDGVKNLIMAITQRQIDPQVVLAACQQAGLASLPMLISRPDLAPAVANILGVAI